MAWKKASNLWVTCAGSTREKEVTSTKRTGKERGRQEEARPDQGGTEPERQRGNRQPKISCERRGKKNQRTNTGEDSECKKKKTSRWRTRKKRSSRWSVRGDSA